MRLTFAIRRKQLGYLCHEIGVWAALKPAEMRGCGGELLRRSWSFVDMDPIKHFENVAGVRIVGSESCT